MNNKLIQHFNSPLLIHTGNDYPSSSNNESSGIFWDMLRRNNPLLDLDNNGNQTKGRKLIKDFDELARNLSNEANKENISNNLHEDLSFLAPIKKEGQNMQEQQENKIETKEGNNNRTNMFFTDYGLGYKCNCQKTSCNKHYCQCFREGRFCFNCNCTDCQNQKPENCSSNKHPMKLEEENNDKKTILISCTCTKSGCNKNYCECFKNKTKCHSLCRCRNCENSEKNFQNFQNFENFNYQCCSANSVSIINNQFNFNKVKSQNIERVSKGKIRICIEDSSLCSFSSEEMEEENIGLKKKRKKDVEIVMSNKKSKLSDDNSYESEKDKKNKDSTVENSLFDKDGNLILSNYRILEIQ